MTNPRRTTALIAALLMLMVPVATGSHVSGLVSAGAEFTITPPSFTGDQGHHLVAHVRVDDEFRPSPVVTVETPDEELVLFVYVQLNRFHVSDGPDGSGGFDSVRMDDAVSGTSWHRVDVVLDGSTATVTINQLHEVTVDTFTAATVGQLGEDPVDLLPPPYEGFERVGVRWDDGDGSGEHTFSTALGDRGWDVVDPEGGVEVGTTLTGLHSRGAVIVDLPTTVFSDQLDKGPAYVHTAIPSGASRYMAEVGHLVDSSLIVPGGQSLLAAISGDPLDPKIHWALEVDRAVGAPETLSPVGWQVVLVGPDGSRTPLGTIHSSNEIRHARVIADTGLDVLEVVLDRSEDAYRFEGLGLDPSAERIAFGDLNGALDPSEERGLIMYDNAAVLDLGPAATSQVAEGFGNHIVTRFAIARSFGSTTGIFGLVDANGDDVMHVKVSGGFVHVTDGVDAQGDPVYKQGPSIGHAFHRLDVVLDGTSTYRFSLDGRTEIVAEAFTAAAQAAPVDDPHALLGVPWTGESVTYDRTRVDQSAMAHDTTFAGPLAGSGFEQVEDEDGDVETEQINGYQSPGRLEIRRLPNKPLAYIHAPTPAVPGTYHAEASFTPLDDVAVPAGMALVAGLTGSPEDPTVLWSVVVEKVGVDAWALAYRAPDGTLTRVSEPAGFTWRSVHVEVDEASDTVLLDVDGGPVYGFTGQDLGTAERIGVGDVFTDPLHEISTFSPLGVAHFDDVAIYRKGAP